MKVCKLSDVGGVDVDGVDLAHPRGPEEQSALRQLFDEQGLIVFRDQMLTKQQLVAVGDLFGGAMLKRAVIPTDPEAPGISTITNRGPTGDVMPERLDELIGKADWHMDLGYVTTPGRGKIIYAVQTPEVGGLTGFIDLSVAYSTLPEALRERIENLHVIQSWDKAQVGQSNGPRGAGTLILQEFPDVIYPMVLTHPVTGAKVLNCPPLWATGILEAPGEEGLALMHEVIAHITRPQSQYWHRYRPGDAILWDNCRFIHAASGTLGLYARTLWTLTLKAGPEFGRLADQQAA